MRVATFNILHGRTVGDGVHPQRLMDCVRRLNPDVSPPDRCAPAPGAGPSRLGVLGAATDALEKVPGASVLDDVQIEAVVGHIR